MSWIYSLGPWKFSVFIIDYTNRSQLSSTDLVESKMSSIKRDFMLVGYCKLLSFYLFILSLFQIFKSQLICFLMKPEFTSNWPLNSLLATYIITYMYNYSFLIINLTHWRKIMHLCNYLKGEDYTESKEIKFAKFWI